MRESFVIDEFRKGIPERGNSTKGKKFRNAVYSGNGKWSGGAIMRHTGAWMVPVWTDRSCSVL